MRNEERCRKCRYKYDDRVCRFCLDFNKYNPMTNSMKIRAMSDEELAECLNSMDACPIEGDWCLHQFDNVQCKQCIEEWLKSEAKE